MRHSSHTIAVAAFASALVAITATAQMAAVDPKLPAYQKVSGIAGNLNSIGSDTMVNMMTLWAEGFQKQYPGVRIQVEGKGSSTAPAALIAGTAQLGPMSREMKSTELDQFETKFGYKPTMVQVAVDALAVYVHKDNPLEQLTLTQVDAIFSKTRNCGGPKDIVNWPDLGLTGAWSKRPISMYGRNSASGTYGYFKTVALCEGDYKDTVKEQPGSASVVQGITEDIAGIGYSGIGYRTSGVKTLKLAKKDGEPFYNSDSETVLSGKKYPLARTLYVYINRKKYPLARTLYVYINRKPGAPFDPLTSEFLSFVLSKSGQEIVLKDGYLPLPAQVVSGELAKLK